MTKPADLVPTREAVALLGGLHPSTLSRWAKEGRLVPAMRLPGTRGPMLFRRSEVLALAAELAAETEATA